MWQLPIIIAVISFFEIKVMWKDKLKKEITVYSVIAVITLAYGYYYLFNYRNASLIRNFFDIFGIKY